MESWQNETRTRSFSRRPTSKYLTWSRSIMTPHDSESWSTLHDMALLYLFLAHATDAQLDPAEKETMVERLTTWQAISDDARLARVIDEALLIYMGSHSHDMLNTVMVSLKEAMSVPDRIAIL